MSANGTAGPADPAASAAGTARLDPRPPAAPRRPPRAGRLALGVLLILLGAAWFADSLGLAGIRWTMVLPAVLLVIGAVLLATAHRSQPGGLVGAGVVVSVLVIATSFLAIPLQGTVAGAGDVQARPATVEDLEAGYGLGVGNLEVDLRGAPLPGEPLTVELGVAVGQLVVRLPDGVTVEVRARTGAGEVVVGDRSQSGLGVEVRERFDGDTPEALLLLELSVGLGQVEVRS